MSEKPLNKKNDLQQDVGDTADNTEIILDEIGDSVEPTPREMTNKRKDTNNGKINTELDLENPD
jgi:hypothetical protein